MRGSLWKKRKETKLVRSFSEKIYINIYIHILIAIATLCSDRSDLFFCSMNAHGRAAKPAPWLGAWFVFGGTKKGKRKKVQITLPG
jgi:hypothetical protein